MSVATCKHGTPAFQPCRGCDDETDKATIIAERDRLRAELACHLIAKGLVPALKFEMPA